MAKNRKSAGQRLARQTLELSMIVKNGALGLARCLESVTGIADRIIVGDTGSTDETANIAKQYNAEVISVPWEDDFARARNHVLARARCDWVLMLDADEMLDAEALIRIPALIAQEATFGFDVWCWNYVRGLDYRCGGQQAVVNPGVIEQARAYPAYFKSFHTRLFRRHPGIYFEHCIHENVADRIDALNLPRRPGNFLIHHFGHAEESPTSRKEKERRYHNLGLQKLAANPGSYQAQLEIGMSELDSARQPAAALPHFELARFLEPDKSIAWLYAGICLSRIGRFVEAHDRLTHAANLDSANPLAHAAMGDVYFQTGDYLNCCRAYERALALGDASPLSSAKLGASEVQLGYGEKGVARVQKAIAENPSNGDLYAILATSAFIAGQHDLGCKAADQRLGMEGARAFDFVLAATMYLHTNNHAKAESIVRAGSLSFPNDLDIQTLMAKYPPTANNRVVRSDDPYQDA